jgi:hypothetical protein
MTRSRTSVARKMVPLADCQHCRVRPSLVNGSPVDDPQTGTAPARALASLVALTSRRSMSRGQSASGIQALLIPRISHIRRARVLARITAIAAPRASHPAKTASSS